MRLVAYMRVSSSQQADAGTIQVQRSVIAGWAKKNGHRVIKWCSDEAVSGAREALARPGLLCVLDELESRRADGVVFSHLDRLARDLVVQEATLGLFAKTGAKVFSVEHGDLDHEGDPYRKAMRQMMGVFAELNREIIRARMEQGRQVKAAKGGYVGGAPRFGTVPVDKELRPDPAEQEAIALMVAMRQDGSSYRDIAAALTAGGHKTKRGGAWQPMTVRRIIHAQAQARGVKNVEPTGV